MKAANEEELKKPDERLAEVEKIENESEISDALKARANSLTKIGDKVRFLFLHHFPRLHGMNLGTILTSPKAGTRKDTRARVTHRHHTDHRPSRVLLLDDQHGQGREVRRSPFLPIFLADSTSSQTNRRRRRLGSPQPPQSLHWPALPLHPPIQAWRRATA